ncbi:hypothetical protein N478_08660 [Pseudoalteromonas luteoviolacea S4060-1]|uniref:Uncharacterized protein n=1 Tax=Pseudoalteromonas luteoviolacea S4060-1 TaxID=1365257 RepID=A0A161YFL4_9GAMM|nr:hypothetical protein N478_08660 [Pseudoalteromonas luteoviolacea S4060-1]
MVKNQTKTSALIEVLNRFVYIVFSWAFFKAVRKNFTKNC